MFSAYAQDLPIALDYQGFAEELKTLPGQYAPPHGALIIARDALGHAVGCVGLRPLTPPATCELKRLYVAPTQRGQRLGRALASHIIAEAQAKGYQQMYLDTLSSMHGAMALYQSLGFEQTSAYYQTPINNTVFFRLQL